MKRCLPIVLAAVLLGLLFGWLAVAQVEIPGYVVTDLQLISQESKTDWSVEWTGPIQAATILAWYAEHGYPAFIRDFNNDGVIDELDTIELAEILGRTFMGAEAVRGTTDVQLVLGLARYVAQFYPDQFELKIYDTGFRQEFASEEAVPFDPSVVGGIELVLENEPSIARYEAELESGEGVILGLEQDDANTYLSGRSFLYEKTSDGYSPIDLAWAEEDHWASGHQGKVLETVGKMDDLFYLDFQGGWTLVEFMLALSPVTDPDGTSAPGECPDDAVAYDVMITELGGYGSIQVEECVTRAGDIDTYTYTVTNLDFLYNGCGLCLFAVPKPLGMATLAHSEAVPWLYSLFPPAWVWRLPIGSCGILPGESAVFSVSVPGPTTDTFVVGVVGSCGSLSADGVYHPGELVPIKTTGPGEPNQDEGCPDLTVRYVDQYCRCDPIEGNCALTVWVDVVNIGTEAVTDPFDIVLRSLDYLPANVGQTYTLPPVLAPGDIWPVELLISFPMSGELCPTSYEAYVDPEFVPNGFIKECDETNNNLLGSIDCYCEEEQEVGACCFADGSCAEVTAEVCTEEGGVEYHPGVSCAIVQCPPPEEDCPDLIVEITEMVCRSIGAGAPLYEITIEALVSNIGSSTVTQSIWVEAESACGDDNDIIHTDLDPGDTAVAEFVINCSANYSGCQDVTVTVDYIHLIDECDEDNNEDTDTFCCR
ncbi:CARDB domain-containing protein [Candidatus Bipolaricaulota bacterium]